MTAATDPWTQLDEKLSILLLENNAYEASQYVQTFIARKAKTLGSNKCSSLVFNSIKKLLSFPAPSEAGAVLVWFIEDGASSDISFRFDNTTNDSSKYCDGQRLLDVLKDTTSDIATVFVERIYGPLHICATKSSIVKSEELSSRLYQLEAVFANIFQDTKKWNNAYKCVVRLNDDFSRLATILDLWSKESYFTEHPLFFARGVLQLLADKKINQANDLVKESTKYINENPEGENADIMSGPLAVWHVAVILSELAALPPMPRVDKAKLFSLLMQLYVRLISQIDPKLIEILEKVGPNVFNYIPPNGQKDEVTPMNFFQNMLANANAPQTKKSNKKSENDLGFDINSVMELLKMSK